MANQYGTYNPLAPDPILEQRKAANRAAQESQQAWDEGRDPPQPLGDFARQLGMVEGPPASSTPTGPGMLQPQSAQLNQIEDDINSQMFAYTPASPALPDGGASPIEQIRAQGNVTEDRSGGLRGQEWLQSQGGGGGMSNWTGRMAAADDTSDTEAFTANQLGLDAAWRGQMEKDFGTSAGNAFNPQAQELAGAEQEYKLARFGQQTETARLSPEQLAALEQKPDARVMAFQAAVRTLGTPESTVKELLDLYTEAFQRPLTAKESADIKLAGRMKWEKDAKKLYTEALTNQQTW